MSFAFCKCMRKLLVFVAGLVTLSLMGALVFSLPLLVASCLT
jgi:hypothetical protein